jgi:hypothetical protein
MKPVEMGLLFFGVTFGLLEPQGCHAETQGFQLALGLA